MVPLRLVHPAAVVPRRARLSDAGLDLVAGEELKLDPGGGRGLVRTGLELALPAGLAALVVPRSGLALHHGVTCLNGPGLIDPGYRGEIGVVLVNTDPGESFVVRPGDRVAQLLFLAHTPVQLVVQEGPFAATDRGAHGFGHTGR